MTTSARLGDCAGNFSGDFLDLTSVDPQRVAWANDRAHISSGNSEAMSSSIFSRLFHTIDRGCVVWWHRFSRHVETKRPKWQIKI